MQNHGIVFLFFLWESCLYPTLLSTTDLDILYGHVVGDVVAPNLFYHKILQNGHLCKVVLLQHNSLIAGSIPMDLKHSIIKGLHCIMDSSFSKDESRFVLYN